MPAAALRGAAQVDSEETPAQDAVAKAARPAPPGAVFTSTEVVYGVADPGVTGLP